jgi:hypothetical protein
VDSLDRIVDFLAANLPSGFEEQLLHVASRAVIANPEDTGQAMVLGRLFQRKGQTALARSAYSLVQFIDEDLGAGKQLAALGDTTTARAEAFALGAAVHPLCRGSLRKVLQRLAATLVGAGSPTMSQPVASLAPETVELCEELRLRMGAPAVPFVAQGHGSDVTFSATQPLTILIGRHAETLPPSDLRFFVARALEQARAGTLAVLRISPDNLRGLLRAVLRVVGASETPFEIAEEAVDEATGLWLKRLQKPEVAALILVDQVRNELIAEATHALVSPPNIEDYIRGCRYTADRLGLFACGRPLVALRALGGAVKEGNPASDETSTPARRQEQLRTSSALRELVTFLLSDEYVALAQAD